LKIYASNASYNQGLTVDEQAYRHYINILDTFDDNDGKFEFLVSEMDRIGKIYEMKDEIIAKRLNDEITSKEYGDYLDEYFTCLSLKNGFIKTLNHADYIFTVYDETGIEPQFIFDAGYLRLFGSGMDIVCVVALMLLFSGMISDEYYGKYGAFANILRCAKNGRHKTFKAKFTVAVIISFVISAICVVIDFMFVLKNYGLPSMGSVLLSIEAFGGINADMLVWQYMTLFFIFKILGYAMLSCFILSVSGITKNNISTLILICGFAFIPNLASYIGVHFLDVMNINGILSIFNQIEFADIFKMNYFAYCAAFTSIYMSICAALMMKAKKIYIE
jgi:hypothetical protein